MNVHWNFSLSGNMAVCRAVFKLSDTWLPFKPQADIDDSINEMSLSNL